APRCGRSLASDLRGESRIEERVKHTPDTRPEPRETLVRATARCAPASRLLDWLRMKRPLALAVVTAIMAVSCGAVLMIVGMSRSTRAATGRPQATPRNTIRSETDQPT